MTPACINYMLSFSLNLFVLQTFTDKDLLIAGQYPLSGNSVDLFRLLYDNDSNIVVVTNKLSDIPSVSSQTLQSASTKSSENI